MKGGCPAVQVLLNGNPVGSDRNPALCSFFINGKERKGGGNSERKKDDGRGHHRLETSRGMQSMLKPSTRFPRSGEGGGEREGALVSILGKKKGGKRV